MHQADVSAQFTRRDLIKIDDDNNPLDGHSQIKLIFRAGDSIKVLISFQTKWYWLWISIS
jgi:hypothetical protein